MDFSGKEFAQGGLVDRVADRVRNIGAIERSNVRAAQKQILQDQLTEINAKLEEMMHARDLLEYKIVTFDDHVAKINAGELSDDEIEELWTMKHFKKQEIPLAVE